MIYILIDEDHKVTTTNVLPKLKYDSYPTVMSIEGDSVLVWGSNGWEVAECSTCY